MTPKTLETGNKQHPQWDSWTKRVSSSLEKVAVVAQKFQGAQEEQLVSHKGHGQLSPLSCSCNSIQCAEREAGQKKGKTQLQRHLPALLSSVGVS